MKGQLAKWLGVPAGTLPEQRCLCASCSDSFNAHRFGGAQKLKFAYLGWVDWRIVAMMMYFWSRRVWFSVTQYVGEQLGPALFAETQHACSDLIHIGVRLAVHLTVCSAFLS